MVFYQQTWFNINIKEYNEQAHFTKVRSRQNETFQLNVNDNEIPSPIVFSLQDVMVTVFENGKLLKDYTFAEIRERAELHIIKEAKKAAAN